MAKGKDLPAIDFHAAVARRDPALADRLAREGLAPPVTLVEPQRTLSPAPPQAVVVPVVTPCDEEEAQPAASADLRRRRGLVPRANGRETGRITVYVDPDLAIKLKKYCFDRDTTMNDVAGKVLVKALESLLARA
jgi:hypothetical protein